MPLTFDDVVNAEGAEWVEDQADIGTYNPPRDYVFPQNSASGARTITMSALLFFASCSVLAGSSCVSGPMLRSLSICAIAADPTVRNDLDCPICVRS